MTWKPPIPLQFHDDGWKDGPFGVLLDIDGLLYVEDEPIEEAYQAFSELRELSTGVRLMTNITSRSRRAVRKHLLGMGFEVSLEEVLTTAAMAERHLSLSAAATCARPRLQA